MKISLFILSVLTFISALIFYFLKKKNEPNLPSIEQTTISVKQSLIKVGKRGLHSDVTAKYVIYNTGDNNLFISDVKPDCHCTVAEFPKTAIRPKDSAIVSLKYDATYPGPFQSSATIHTNTDPNTSLLVFRGEIEK